MRLASASRTLLATTVAAMGFVLLYEATIYDSQSAARQAAARETTARPSPGARLRFMATAYCKGETTASGVGVRSGIAAADPDLLPVGSVIETHALSAPYNGIYTIMDTGPSVRGRIIDIYTWSCHDALRFGRRSVLLTVLRLGWDPRAVGPDVIKSLLLRRERPAPPLLPSQPLSAPSDPIVLPR